MRGSTAGIGDGLKGISSTYHTILTISDQLLSSIIITPLIVCYWRGTWLCMDKFVYNDHLEKSAIVSIIIGFIGSLFFTIGQNIFLKHIRPDIDNFRSYLITRLYSACFGIVCVNQFRGTWMCLDYLTPYNANTVFLITIISILILGCTKTIRNLSAAPFAITIDRYEDYFTVPTFYKYSSDRIWLYLWDCIFSVCVIGTLVVFVWRGTWCLLDLLLFPGNPVMSAFASTAIGYTLVLITFSLQPLMKYLAKTLNGLMRLIVVDIYLLFSFCGTVNVWRGIWNLLNHFFLPSMPCTSFILTHVMSFLILVLMNASNSILVRGVYLDWEEQGEQSVDFPCYYLRIYFQARRQKKLLKEFQKNSAENNKHPSADLDSITILTPDTKKPITIIAQNQNNNESTPMI